MIEHCNKEIGSRALRSRESRDSGELMNLSRSEF
jgi:hypothetical protein